MNATENIQKTVSYLNGIQKLCRTLKIMFWLYLGCLILAFPSGFPFFHETPNGFRVIYQTYTEFSTMPWYGFVLYAAGAGLFIWAVVTFYQLLGLYERGMIFSEANGRLFRRLGWLAVGYGVVVIVLAMWFYSMPSYNPWDGHVLRRNSWDLLMRGFFALLSSPWIMGGLFLITISRVILKGCELQEELELTV
jgi:hypothetical protein